MISYTTFFNQILNQYIAKRQNDPHFFNGRTDQEAMGFMVAVNAFREELAHPTTKKITDKPTIQKNLPTVSGSYEETEIGKWLYDIELVARTQAQKLGNSKLSNEDIASQIFRSKFVPPENPLLEILYPILLIIYWVVTFIILSYCILIPTLDFILPYIPKSVLLVLNSPWVSYTILSLVSLLTFCIVSKVPVPVAKNFYTKNFKFFVVFIIIAYLYIAPLEFFQKELELRAKVFLATTILLTVVIRSFFLNTRLPAGYYDLDSRLLKIFLDISLGGLVFTSTLLFIKSFNQFLSNSYYLAIYFIILLIVVLFLTTVVSKLFDSFLSHLH